MLAFASLNLRDPRMHEERNLNKRKGLYWRFARLLAARQKYIWERTKILFKPKIVEKEVEVEKIVEKIVEKPVIQEKIIEKEIEVPKQIEKKVFVHVPFPTDDPEVIKKGPMIYNDKDIDKGKKIVVSEERITKGSENDYHPVNQYIDEQSKLRRARSSGLMQNLGH